MNLTDIQLKLQKFIRLHRVQFEDISKHQSQLLELAALVIATEHYRLNGYKIVPANLIGGRFKVKSSAKGYPFNFSWFRARREDAEVEIHSNLSVLSAYTHDDGVYVVDVGIVKSGCLPSKKSGKGWKGVNNLDLITFIEAKKLVIYPMLLAQFIGIVHEIKPSFLKKAKVPGLKRGGHFSPALVSVGYLHGTSRSIRNGFTERGFKVNIVPALDIEVAKLRGGKITESPFSI